MIFDTDDYNDRATNTRVVYCLDLYWVTFQIVHKHQLCNVRLNLKTVTA